MALSFGKDPKTVYWNRLKDIPSITSPFVREYEKTRELALRAIKWEKLFEPVLPFIYVNWAIDNDLPFPEELAEKIKSRNADLADWKKMYEELLEKTTTNLETANRIIDSKNQRIDELENIEIGVESLSTKERSSLLKIIIGMAIGGYGYVPSSSRSPISKQIADDLALYGISLDQDTVRKWLKEATTLLPQDFEIPED